MPPTFKSRLIKLNSIIKKLRLDRQELADKIAPPMSVHELNLILGSEDTIYRNEETVAAIEKYIKSIKS